MANNYESEVAVKALLAEKTILFPTDTVWSVGCLPYATSALSQMLHLKRSTKAENFEVLFNSITQIKRFVPFLHPRLETLLAFHLRPLTMLVDGALGLPKELSNEEGLTAIRLVQDELSIQLIEEVESPIISIAANPEGAPFPNGFGSIRSDFLQGVDYIMKIRQKDLLTQAQLSVMVKLDEHENLIFLRE